MSLAFKTIELKGATKDEVDTANKETATFGEDEEQRCCGQCIWFLWKLFETQRIQHLISVILTYSYDILTVLISIADVTTDVWVIYNFKIENRETFFIIALIVMIVAQLSYAIAFVVRFHLPARYDNECEWFVKNGLLFLCILPLTPVISFIFLWASTQNNLIIKILTYFEFEDTINRKVNKTQAPILIWLKKKMVKHMGFVLEAIIEALPQSIIQLIAIVYYQDTQIINVISICISLLSVATKSMVFSIAIDFRVFIYNWLSLVCDFFGIFAIIAWVFYNPDNPGQITFLGEIWLYKATMTWLLVIFCIGVPLCGSFFWQIIKDEFGSTHAQRITNYGWPNLIIYSSLLFIFFAIIWSFGATFSVIICEIMFFSPWALVFYLIAHERYVKGFSSILAKHIFDFILDAKSLHNLHLNSGNNNNENKNENKNKKNRNEKENGNTKEPASKNENENEKENDDYENDKIMSMIDSRILHSKEEKLFRLVFANYCLMEFFKYKEDIKLTSYLTKNIETEWRTVGLSELELNCSKPDRANIWCELKSPWIEIPIEVKNSYTYNRRDPCYKLIFYYIRIVYTYCLLFFVIPLFFISRLFSMIFALFSFVYYWYIFGDTSKIELLQWLLTVCYFIFIILWIISIIRCLNFYVWSMLLFPGSASSYWVGTYTVQHQQAHLQRLSMMQKYYNQRLDWKYTDKLRRQVVIDILGNDIGGLVLTYWPRFELQHILEKFRNESKDFDTVFDQNEMRSGLI